MDSTIDISEIAFDDKGLVPAVAQSALTGRVLMLAYMNREAVEKTISTGLVHYYSRSRERLWKKGETSGNVQKVRAIRYDCDMDSLLISIDQTGPACHTGEESCFFRRLDSDGGEVDALPSVLGELFEVLKERRSSDPESSYVAGLYKKGRAKILEKVAEESGELLEAAGNGGVEKDIIHETADLWFHTLVLLSDAGIDVTELFGELRKRFGTSGIEEKRSREKKG